MVAPRLLGVLLLLILVQISWPAPSEAKHSAAAQDLPIIDVHMHLQAGWDPADLTDLLDRLGVARAGQGARGTDAVALGYAALLPDRIIPIVGSRFGQLVCGAGEDA